MRRSKGSEINFLSACVDVRLNALLNLVGCSFVTLTSSRSSQMVKKNSLGVQLCRKFRFIFSAFFLFLFLLLVRYYSKLLPLENANSLLLNQDSQIKCLGYFAHA
jgi:hypothetical protein